MAQEIDLKIKGLYSHPNNFSEVPHGALTIADNVVIDRESVAEVRRGQKQYGDQLTVASSEIHKLFEYSDRLLVHYDDSYLAYDSDGAGTWTNYSGTYDAPDANTKMHAISANQNFYFTTDVGVKKIDSLTSTPVGSGMPRGLDGSAALTGASGFMTNNTQVAYRILWGYKDANKNLLLGSPSQRIIISNSTGGTRDVDVTFTVPSGVTTDYFYQVYRSDLSASSTTEPNDEMYLVYENNPTAGEITAKSVTVTDSISTDLTGATLYTSPSQEGIANSNEVPPYCKDIAVFKNHALYANVKTKHRLYLTIIDGSGGLAVDDTITIAGVTYTAKASENTASAQFLTDTSGTAAQNIDNTARSLVKVINQYSGTTDVYAYYISGYDDLPGQILIEERSLGGSSFAATSSNGNVYSPILPTSGTTVSSDNETKINRIYVSKIHQPEAVPFLNYIDIGSADEPILRVLPLRESAFVLKTDGIYRITGTTFANFDVTLFDNTARLLAAESAVVLNNQVFSFTDQGVTTISDGGGVAIVSRPIENTLLKLSSDLYPSFGSVTFGVAYESERKYMLFTVTNTGDTYATQGFVYNAFTQSWTRWVMDRTCGLVLSENGKLYMGHPTTDYIHEERKSYALTDYADNEVAVTITGSSGTTVSLSSTASIDDGWTLKQGNTASYIVSVDSATDVTVRDTKTWSAGAAIAYEPIQAVVQFAPVFGGNPSALKQFTEITYLFDDASFTELTAGFSNSFAPNAIYNVTLEAQLSSGWGTFGWGTIPWGELVGFTQAIRTYVPLAMQRCLWMYPKITLNEAFKSFGLAGIHLMFHAHSTRIK